MLQNLSFKIFLPSWCCYFFILLFLFLFLFIQKGSLLTQGKL